MAGYSRCSTSGQAQKHWLEGHTGQQLHSETVKKVIGTYLFTVNSVISYFSLESHLHRGDEGVKGVHSFMSDNENSCPKPHLSKHWQLGTL